jgi:hypothetical protein
LTDLARQIADNRRIRREAARLTRAAIDAGRDALIPLPIGQPAKRDTYLAVNGAAWAKLGTGRYRIRADGDAVRITIIKGIDDGKRAKPDRALGLARGRRFLESLLCHTGDDGRGDPSRDDPHRIRAR